MARRGIDVGSEVDGGCLRQKRAPRKSRQKHRTRKTSDSPAGSARRRTGLVRCTQSKTRGQNGPHMPAFDEARRGVFIRGAELVQDKYSRRKLS